MSGGPDPAIAYLDTHAAAWLYAGRCELFPEATRRVIGEHALLVSPAVLLELQYLFEIGRTEQPGAEVIADLGEQLGLRLCGLPFAEVVRAAAKESWTRDPFDRLIVGQAAARGAMLVTKDRTIHEHYPRSVWGEAASE
jgi:PIN domain nuclease of toxin-antitoxin system